MGLARLKNFPWFSLALLLISYASFGWFLSGTLLSEELDLLLEELPIPAFFEWAVEQHNLSKAILVLSIGWIWLITLALMSPLTNFNRFVTRWFKSDTVAFLTICMVAGLAAVFLFWLHIFLFVITVIAAESLARIDLQTEGFAEWEAFWTLTSFSLLGLVGGWGMREMVPKLLPAAPPPDHAALLVAQAFLPLYEMLNPWLG